MRASLTLLAERDLDGILSFVAADSPRSAARLRLRIMDKVKQLAAAPGIGRPRDELIPGLRSAGVGTYVVFYRPFAGGIVVVRVLHGRRDIDGIFRGD